MIRERNGSARFLLTLPNWGGDKNNTTKTFTKHIKVVLKSEKLIMISVEKNIETGGTVYL